MRLLFYQSRTLPALFVMASPSTLPLAVLYDLHAYQNTASSCSASHYNNVNVSVLLLQITNTAFAVCDL